MNISVEVRKLDSVTFTRTQTPMTHCLKYFIYDSVSPIALNEDPSMWEAISLRLLELIAYVSDVIEDMLDMDIVSNFISAAILLKELDSIMDDIFAWWAVEEKDDDSSIAWISFFIIMDEPMDDDDSL